jgi:2-polyprenyl-3-methyl-5-hydroxy-6-metoxy-1,4-benzoquinol methylase
MKALGVKIDTTPFEQANVPEGHYDAVLSFHTIEHVPDIKSTFTKIAHILKPEGAVLIEVPTGPEEYGNPDHVQFFNEESLARFLSEFFEDVKIVPNVYETRNGVQIGSLYGVGRRPKGRAA